MTQKTASEAADQTPFDINGIVPWGRNASEYQRMFSLSDDDNAGRILDCGGGPASFNAEQTAAGNRVISCDPLYGFSAKEIRRRIDATFQPVVLAATRDRDCFVWNDIASPYELGRRRMQAMKMFLSDYDGGKAAGRYVNAALPSLPIESNSFELAVCSHFLFLYAEELAEEFHTQSIRELLRVAAEVRIFPLFDRQHKVSRHVGPVLRALVDHAEISIEKVNYEFQKGADEMMRLKRRLK